MMNNSLGRAYSQFYKNTKLMSQNLFRLMDTTIWPLTLLFGFVFLTRAINNDPMVVAMVVLGMIGWQVVQQTQMGIAVSYMDEFWSHSLTHLLVTPIRLWEFVLGGIMTGILKCAIVTVLFFITMHFAYGVSIPDPFSFFAALFFLFIFGISIGLINLAIIFPHSENAIFLVWTIPDILVIFSGVYYPLELLPDPLHSIALLLPSSHAFNLIKQPFGLASADWFSLILLSVIWLVGSWMLLQFSFNGAKKSGKLVRVA